MNAYAERDANQMRLLLPFGTLRGRTLFNKAIKFLLHKGIALFIPYASYASLLP